VKYACAAAPACLAMPGTLRGGACSAAAAESCWGLLQRGARRNKLSGSMLTPAALAMPARQKLLGMQEAWPAAMDARALFLVYVLCWITLYTSME